MGDFLEKGYVFLKSVYRQEDLQKINNAFFSFFREYNVQSHLNKREDSKTDYFYVNNTFNQLNSFHKQQYYYLPVIDNRGTHDRISDIGLIDIYNIHKLIPDILEIIDINVIISILNKLTQIEWKFFRVNMHINNNVHNPSNYHYDHFDENIKYTVYLSDIKDMNDGPPSFIEGTHKNKKFSNHQIKHFLGSVGDVLISTQHGYHKKNVQKNSMNYYLVFNFVKK